MTLGLSRLTDFVDALVKKAFELFVKQKYYANVS